MALSLTTPLGLFSFRNKFYGKDALVIAAGPSAPHYQSVLDQYLDEKPLIVTIKQAFNFIKHKSDIHFFNSLNCCNYYPGGKPKDVISIYQDDLDMKRQFNAYDIRLEVLKDKNDPWSDCLVLNKNIEKYSVKNRGCYRPWGPGIMLESVFYMLNFMGIHNIHTVGFDVADKDGNYKHCYEKKPKSKYKYHDITMYNYMRHLAGLDYNTGHGPINSKNFPEVHLIKELMPSFHDWLRLNGSNLFIHTNSSFMKEYDFVLPI